MGLGWDGIGIGIGWDGIVIGMGLGLGWDLVGWDWNEMGLGRI